MFHSTRAHCRLGSRPHEGSALSLTVADRKPPTEPVIADIVLLLDHRPRCVEVPCQLIRLLLIAFPSAFQLLELTLQFLDLGVLALILLLLPST